MSWLTDLTAVLRGVERVNEALLSHQRKEIQKFWKNSSLRSASLNVCQTIEDKISDFMVQDTDGQVIQTIYFVIHVADLLTIVHLHTLTVDLLVSKVFKLIVLKLVACMVLP